jgi:hypothetical protein
MEHLLSVPVDVWKLIFEYLNRKDANTLALTSKFFHSLLHAHAPPCWTILNFDQHLFRRDHWKDKYFVLYIFQFLSLPRFATLKVLSLKSKPEISEILIVFSFFVFFLLFRTNPETPDAGISNFRHSQRIATILQSSSTLQTLDLECKQNTLIFLLLTRTKKGTRWEQKGRPQLLTH